MPSWACIWKRLWGLKRPNPGALLRRLVKDQLIEIILLADEIPASYTEDLFDEYKFSNRPSFRVFKFSSPGKELPADFAKNFRAACQAVNKKKMMCIVSTLKATNLSASRT